MVTTSSSLFIPHSSVPEGFDEIEKPDPLQEGQVDEVCIAPKIVFVTLRT